MFQRSRVSMSNGRTSNVDRVTVCPDWRLFAEGKFHNNTAKQDVGWVVLRILILTSRIQISARGLVIWGLGALAKLRKATTSFVMSVRLSVRMEQLGCHWTDFREIWFLIIFRKYSKKMQAYLKSDEINGYCTRRPVYIYSSTLHEDLCIFTAVLYMKTCVHLQQYFTWRPVYIYSSTLHEDLCTFTAVLYMKTCVHLQQ